MPFAARSNYEFATAPATAADVLDEQGKGGVSSRYTGYIAPGGSTSSQTRAVTDSPYAVVGVAVQGRNRSGPVHSLESAGRVLLAVAEAFPVRPDSV
jgi:hypothetical protein